MAADYRILGRDTSLRLTQDGTLLQETSAIKNIDFKPEITLNSEGFLGEAGDRHREIFKAIDVSFGVEPEGIQILQMQFALYQRARSGQANNLQINLGYRLLFPSGAIVRITLPDLKFSDIGGLVNAGRESFLTMSFAAKTDRYILNV
jgi:hypothetical protein